MGQQELQISGEPIGEGRERVCYVHPDDSSKLIKIQKGDCDTQTRRELRLYRWLSWRRLSDYRQIPRFYGKVETNLGPGFVTDLVRDYDGRVSASLYWFFDNGYPMEEFLPYLDELKQYLLDNQILISTDLTRSNVLLQKLDPARARLVIIDGLGNHSAINWFDIFKAVSDRKIERRWRRFMTELKRRSDQMLAAYGAPPRQLEAAYRRTGGDC